jgi:hypothetical protein
MGRDEDGAMNEEDYFDDDEEVSDPMAACHEDGRRAFESCNQCGVPLCPMCFECGAGFCDRHPDERFEDIEMVTKIELRLALTGTSIQYLLNHVITLNGEVYHYVMKDRTTTPCGYEIFGAKTLRIERWMEGQLCARCARVVESIER